MPLRPTRPDRRAPLTTQVRVITGTCTHCHVRYEWTNLPLLRDALCPNCMERLQPTSSQLQWPVVTDEHPRTGLLTAVHWKEMDQSAGGTPKGPCWFIFVDGRREDRGWMSRARAAAYAKEYRVIFEAF
jgi:hypothetical protein